MRPGITSDRSRQAGKPELPITGQPALCRANRNAGMLRGTRKRNFLFKMGLQNGEARHRQLALFTVQDRGRGGRLLIASYVQPPCFEPAACGRVVRKRIAQRTAGTASGVDRKTGQFLSHLAGTMGVSLKGPQTYTI